MNGHLEEEQSPGIEDLRSPWLFDHLQVLGMLERMDLGTFLS